MIINWVSSYLHDRHQYVQLERHQYSSVLCGSGIPQGGVLSALLFIAYVAPVGDVISGCGMNYNQYADDMQLFIAVCASKIQSELSVIKVCSTLVQQWFTINELLLNPDKSEVIFFGTSAQLKSAAAVNTVTVAGSCLPLTTEVKSVGVILDCRLSFDAHVNAVCRACNYHIWALGHIRRLLPDDIAKMLACSIVATRLDYCNSLLYGSSKGNLSKLQEAQNSLLSHMSCHKFQS
jgi:Reverse transcriptase (RNA-dependent DNA polymerase)